MAGALDDVLNTLRSHESELRRLGVAHAAVNSDQILHGECDVVNRRTIKPVPRGTILRDAVHAF